MKVRLGSGVRLRRDEFGGICYVAHRDDFFAVTKPVYSALRQIDNEWRYFGAEWQPTYSCLAQLGICETVDPHVDECPYSGPSFLGPFQEIPTVSLPLVLNCFTTAHCPLRCVYCHADDLMQEFRATETVSDLDNVIATSRDIQSLVAVITGGDPITRPERARRLIEGLAPQKALVLDTSGVGDIDQLLDLLIKHQVHVRVSLDSIDPRINGRTRPINPKYVHRSKSSLHGAEATIRKCLGSGVAVTVQSVVSAQNENEDIWYDLRDKLIDMGVKNWVLHIAVKAGAARARENLVGPGRPRSVMPSRDVRARIWSFVKATRAAERAIDIRVTDTDSSPNSVLLVGSKGDLFTEGYAHNGKVLLYKANAGRPDLSRALWPHLDRFGHARRYLNWNRGFFDDKSLEEICYEVPLPVQPSIQTAGRGVVETEGKYRVLDSGRVRAYLETQGFTCSGAVKQRDEYFDNEERNLHSLDYVVRIRLENESIMVCVKGPRFYAATGEYSRIELEFEGKSEEQIRAELIHQGLRAVWFLEKRREEYHKPGGVVIVAVDELPELGYFVEIEGPLDPVRALRSELGGALEAEPCRSNYAELMENYWRSIGVDPTARLGAGFEE